MSATRKHSGKGVVGSASDETSQGMTLLCSAPEIVIETVWQSLEVAERWTLGCACKQFRKRYLGDRVPEPRHADEWHTQQRYLAQRRPLAALYDGSWRGPLQAAAPQPLGPQTTAPRPSGAPEPAPTSLRASNNPQPSADVRCASSERPGHAAAVTVTPATPSPLSAPPPPPFSQAVTRAGLVALGPNTGAGSAGVEYGGLFRPPAAALASSRSLVSDGHLTLLADSAARVLAAHHPPRESGGKVAAGGWKDSAAGVDPGIAPVSGPPFRTLRSLPAATCVWLAPEPPASAHLGAACWPHPPVYRPPCAPPVPPHPATPQPPSRDAASQPEGPQPPEALQVLASSEAAQQRSSGLAAAQRGRQGGGGGVDRGGGGGGGCGSCGGCLDGAGLCEGGCGGWAVVLPGSPASAACSLAAAELLASLAALPPASAAGGGAHACPPPAPPRTVPTSAPSPSSATSTAAAPYDSSPDVRLTYLDCSHHGMYGDSAVGNSSGGPASPLLGLLAAGHGRHLRHLVAAHCDLGRRELALLGRDDCCRWLITLDLSGCPAAPPPAAGRGPAPAPAGGSHGDNTARTRQPGRRAGGGAPAATDRTSGPPDPSLEFGRELRQAVARLTTLQVLHLRDLDLRGFFAPSPEDSPPPHPPATGTAPPSPLHRNHPHKQRPQPGAATNATGTTPVPTDNVGGGAGGSGSGCVRPKEEASAAALGPLAPTLASLRQLDLEGSAGVGPGQLVALLRVATRLTRLALARCRGLAGGDTPLSATLAAAGQGFSRAGKGGGSGAAPALQHPSCRLHSLSVGWGFDAPAVRQLCSAAAAASFVTSLELGVGAVIQDAGLAAVAAACPHLQELRLALCAVSGEGVGAVLAGCGKVHVLHVVGCVGPFRRGAMLGRLRWLGAGDEGPSRAGTGVSAGEGTAGVGYAGSGSEGVGGGGRGGGGSEAVAAGCDGGRALPPAVRWAMSDLRLVGGPVELYDEDILSLLYGRPMYGCFDGERAAAASGSGEEGAVGRIGSSRNATFRGSRGDSSSSSSSEVVGGGPGPCAGGEAGGGSSGDGGGAVRGPDDVSAGNLGNPAHSSQWQPAGSASSSGGSSRLGRLHTLALVGLPYLSKALLNHLRGRCVNLRHVRLEDSGLGTGVSPAREAGAGGRREGGPFTSAALVGWLEGCRQLRNLRLRHCCQLDSEFVSHLTTSCPSLETLLLDKCDLPPCGFSARPSPYAALSYVMVARCRADLPRGRGCYGTRDRSEGCDEHGSGGGGDGGGEEGRRRGVWWLPLERDVKVLRFE